MVSEKKKKKKKKCSAECTVGVFEACQAFGGGNKPLNWRSLVRSSLWEIQVMAMSQSQKGKIGRWSLDLYMANWEIMILDRLRNPRHQAKAEEDLDLCDKCDTRFFRFDAQCNDHDI